SSPLDVLRPGSLPRRSGGGQGSGEGRGVNASDRYRVDGAACMLDGQILPVMNISVGGLFAVSDKPPMTGQVLSMELVLPVREQPLLIQGLVTWVNTDDKVAHLPRGFGIKITQ